ncbi:MAG TPA: nucleotidyltransferase domain-containing protein [Burkholderiaceae bacterium]
MKTIKGHEYWYYQMPDLTGKQKQIFLGRATAELSALIDQHRRGDETTTHLRQLTRQAIAAGCPSIVPSHAKIIERLADAGFFQAGGILVGTHVYMAYQNYLGVRWTSGAQTVDLDFAHAGRNVSVAIPSDVTMDMGSEIEALKMGFVPVASLTTYVKSDEQDLQIDFVTSMHRVGDTPVLIKALNAAMQPLKFMEFSMEAPIQLTLLAQRGPITVNAPPPEKYALHKLLVYGERPQAMRIKASKDLDQAASLIECLVENDADLLHDTWLDLIGRGVGWRRRALEGLKALRKRFPAIDVAALEIPAAGA